MQYLIAQPSFGGKCFHYNEKSVLFLITCTSSDRDKSPAQFKKKDKGKIAGGVALRFPLCFGRSFTKITAKIVTKINPRIAAKCHAYLQTISKIPATFEIDLGKIVRGVASTRYPVSICFGGS